MSSPPPEPAIPPAPVWREIGRSSPEEALDWTTWVAPMGDQGGALYRSLVVAHGSIVVTVDLFPRRGTAPRTIHRGGCGLPRDPGETAERVCTLLRAADEVVARAANADRNGQG
jgi:hypothetical protein